MSELEEIIYDEEIVNPIIDIIRRYDNFEKEQEARYKALKKKKRKSEYRFAYKLSAYAILFIGVSMFKMNALYGIMDLNIELKELNSRIFEAQKMINNLEYADKAVESDVSLSKLKYESKKLGFTENKKIEYVNFE